MKVCLLSSKPPSQNLGGAELHALKLVRTLADRGHEIDIVCFGHDSFANVSFPPEQKVRVISMPDQPLAEFLDSRTTLRLMRRIRGDVAVMVKGGFGTGSFLLDLICRLRFRRYITIEQLQSDPMPRKVSRRYVWGLLPGPGLWWYRLLLRNYARSLCPHTVVAVSEAVRRILVDEFRFPRSKTIVIHNGANPEQFQFRPEDRARTRQRLGIPETSLVFGSVGRFHPVKGLLVALDGFARVKSRFPERDLRLCLVGSGPQENELRQRTNELGIADFVTFDHYSDAPWEAYNALDIFLMPSLAEGLPQALVEAMACQCCPIAMSVGGVPEVIPEANSGWLIPAGDAETYCEAMIAAANLSESRRRAMGQRAREFVQANFDSRVLFARLAEVIDQNAGARL